ncbi:unnamed protein product, partial [marine sediment metagenome]
VIIIKPFVIIIKPFINIIKPFIALHNKNKWIKIDTQSLKG